MIMTEKLINKGFFHYLPSIQEHDSPNSLFYKGIIAESNYTRIYSAMKLIITSINKAE